MSTPDEPLDQPPPQEIQVVASVGPRLDGVVALLREYLHLTGAARALAVVEGEPGAPPIVIDCPRLAPIEVTDENGTVALPHAIELDAQVPAFPAELRQIPALEITVDEDEAITLTGMIGGPEHMARGVQALAAMLGPRDVAVGLFDTTTPDLAMSISARTGEPVVVTIGEDELDMPAGWPPPLTRD
jgi:hypothetical protein